MMSIAAPVPSIANTMSWEEKTLRSSGAKGMETEFRTDKLVTPSAVVTCLL